MYTLKERVLVLQFTVGFAELGHKNECFVKKLYTGREYLV